MSRIGEAICLGLNSFFREYPKYTADGERYSDAEYREITREFESYYGKYNIDFTDKVVLDAGCGLGGKTVFYGEQGCKQIIGVDMDKTHIDLAQNFAAEKGVTNATFQIESLEEMSFESNSFDLIFLNGVLEHVRREIMKPALAELKRVLKPGGHVFIEFPPWPSPYAAHLYDVIYIPWCHYLFSDATLIAATNKLGPPERDGDLSYTEHFMELNRCTVAEFKKMVADIQYDVVDVDLIVVRKMHFLKKMPFFRKFFISSVHAALSKSKTVS